MHCLNLRRKRRVSYKEELINGLFYNSFGKVPYLCCIEAKGPLIMWETWKNCMNAYTKRPPLDFPSSSKPTHQKSQFPLKAHLPPSSPLSLKHPHSSPPPKNPTPETNSPAPPSPA
jgi:hypothetical protein